MIQPGENSFKFKSTVCQIAAKCPVCMRWDATDEHATHSQCRRLEPRIQWVYGVSTLGTCPNILRLKTRAAKWSVHDCTGLPFWDENIDKQRVFALLYIAVRCSARLKSEQEQLRWAQPSHIRWGALNGQLEEVLVLIMWQDCHLRRLLAKWHQSRTTTMFQVFLMLASGPSTELQHVPTTGLVIESCLSSSSAHQVILDLTWELMHYSRFPDSVGSWWCLYFPAWESWETFACFFILWGSGAVGFSSMSGSKNLLGWHGGINIEKQSIQTTCECSVVSCERTLMFG